MSKSRASSTKVVAITGAAGYLGSKLLSRLADNPRYDLVMALDETEPRLEHDKIVFHRVDLAGHGADRFLVDCLRAHNVDTVVHLRFLSEPTHRQAWAHELEAIGTLHVLNACAELSARKVVMLSTTACYGPHPQNPNYLTEDHPLRGLPGCRFMDDKVEAERQLFRYKRENTGTVVTSLRMAFVVGPNTRNWVTRYLSLPAPMTILGHDPLVQLLHESDSADALALAVEQDVDGSFNIAGDGVIRLSSLLRICRRTPVPVPETLARLVCHAIWVGQVMPLQPAFLPFLRYLCVADTRRAREQMGFAPRYSTAEAAAAFAGGLRLGGLIERRRA